jgi:hypothetical protein
MRVFDICSFIDRQKEMIETRGDAWLRAVDATCFSQAPPRKTPVNHHHHRPNSRHCLPVASCVGFSMSKDRRFSDAYVDFFDNPAWDEVRRRTQVKPSKCGARVGRGRHVALFRARIRLL